MKNKLRFLILAVICLVGLNFAFTQTSVNVTWEAFTGPYGGSGGPISIDQDSNLFFGNSNGLFKSTNQGINWTKTSAKLAHVYVDNIVIVPNTDIILAGIDGAIIKSIDNGTNWIDLEYPFSDGNRGNKAIAVNQENSNIIYVGKSSNGSGVYKSIDGGYNWTNVGNISSGLTNLNIKYLQIDKDNYNILYAGTDGGGLFRSIDAGNTWTAINGNINESTYIGNTYVNTLVFYSDKLYVGTGNSIYYSTNYSTENGEEVEWYPITSGPNNGVNTMYFTDDIFYVSSLDGIYKSTDNGVVWSSINTNLPSYNIRDFAVEPSDYNTIYITIDRGVYKTENGGNIWQVINTGITVNVSEIAVSISSPDIIHIGTQTDANYFTTTDNGENWNLHIYGCHIESIELDINNINRIFMFTGYSTCDILKSDNNGQDWISIRSGELYTYDTRTLAIDPTNAEILYTGTSNGVYKSINSGLTWEHIDNSGLSVIDVNRLVVASTNPSIIYAGTDGGGIFKITENDNNWTSMNTGLTGYDVNELAIDKNNNNYLYAIVDYEFYKSTDGGNTWSHIQVSGLGLNNTIIIDPNNSDIIYTTANNWTPVNIGHVYRSINGGLTWTEISNGLSEIEVADIFVNSQNSNELYLGTTSGLYKGSLLLINDINFINPTCAGENDGTITITATGTEPLQYSIDNGTTFQLSNEFTGLTPGEYQISVKDANETIVSWDETIIITEPETVNLGNDITVCEGQIVTLDAGNFETYLWNDESTEQTLAITESGTYSVTVTDENNCVSTDEIIVTLNPLPTANITSGDATICEGETTDISIALTGTAPWNFTYTDGTTPTTETTSDNPYIFTVSTAVTYQVTAVSDANCTGTDFGNSATVTVNSLPTANITSGNATICEGETSDISIALTGTAPWNITYTDGTTPTTETTSDNPYIFTVSTAGTYQVTAVSDANCTGTDFGNTITITVNPLPTASFTYELNGLMATFTNSSEYADSYQWDFGDDNTSTETEPVHTYASAGEYQVELTSLSNACGVATDIQTIALTTSIAEMEFSKLVTFYPNPANGRLSIIIDASVTGEIHIEIITVNGQMVHKKRYSSPNQIQPIDLSNQAKGVYIIRLIANELIKTGKLIIE